MKIVAGWFSARRGAALGILIGALTLGKAVPYLLAAVSGGDWRLTVLLASGLSASGGVIAMIAVRDGPLTTAAPAFDPRAAMRVLTRRGTRLGVLGYLGHMWELYAMWTWVGVYVAAALASRGTPQAARLGALAAFVAIAAGAAGAIVAGIFADRHGRARVAAWALMTSATCCALTVPAFRAPYAVLLLLVGVWGFSVVADSAQFSAIVSETTDEEYLGTALTLQTCLGFLLTMVSIRATSAVAGWLGWQWAFLLLMPGPLLGVQAMVALMKPRITRE
jgi:MFS family permease